MAIPLRQRLLCFSDLCSRFSVLDFRSSIFDFLIFSGAAAPFVAYFPVQNRIQERFLGFAGRCSARAELKKKSACSAQNDNPEKPKPRSGKLLTKTSLPNFTTRCGWPRFPCRGRESRCRAAGAHPIPARARP